MLTTLRIQAKGFASQLPAAQMRYKPKAQSCLETPIGYGTALM